MKNKFLIQGVAPLLLSIFMSIAVRAQVIDSTTSLFNIDTVAKYLGYPWEILYGPDDSLWITEARGYKVVRISANRTAAQKNWPAQEVLQVPLGSAEVSFNRSIAVWPQGGMQGMVLHPEFKTGKPWVYLSYIYSGTCTGGASPCYFKTKIVRCEFFYKGDAGSPNPAKDTLTIKDTIIANLPGSNDHNSGRLAISPVKEGPDNTYKLYYTIGDMGAGQFGNISRPNNAQNRDTCEGKILRLNTEPDADGNPATPIHDYDYYRKWIPNDNPFNHTNSAFATLKTPVYSWGHRNAQGIVWGNVGGVWRLYSSEHGDKSDDEVNVIQAGENYGWPKVAGMADDNYSSTDAYSNNDRLANQLVSWSEIAWASTNNMKRPLFSFFNCTAASVPSSGADIFTWPTIAPSGIDFYSGNIPGWKNSLLVTSLKYGVYRLKLNAAGTFVDSTISSNLIDTFPLLHGWRVRDMAIHPIANSGKFWVVIDSAGNTSGPTGGFSGTTDGPTLDGGKVLLLSYKSAITLPVQFTAFSGRLLSNQALLYWQAEMDANHKWFEIERSIDRQVFTAIGKVTTGFNFIDASPQAGNNYYRIKEVGKDGKVVYSKIIIIAYLPENLVLSIYPIPVQDKVMLKIFTGKPLKISLLVSDASGRPIYTEDVNISGTTRELNLDATEWPAQLYMVKIIGPRGKVLALQKFVKQ